MIPDLCVVVPSYNESGNIAPLFEKLSTVLQGVRWEVLFVDDDSSDQTRAEIRAVAERDNRVRLIHRIGRRGLSSACIEGMLATMAPVVAVMDADLQHDERILPQMHRLVEEGEADIVVGSRYVDGGDAAGLSGIRLAMSRGATRISQLLTRVSITDPMSGFFVVSREKFLDLAPRLSGRGFKILLDILISSPNPLRCREVPYRFRERNAGESKLDTAVLWEFALVILTKLLGSRVPIRFLMFVLVGGLGIVLHFIVLALLLGQLETSFATAQTAALVVAMTANFFLNNLFTYRDLRLRGKSLVVGLAAFYVACSLGAILNLATAEYLYERSFTWWISGGFGAIAGAVWNFSVSSVFTWQGHTKKAA